jgi:uncharacterized protein HemX
MSAPVRQQNQAQISAAVAARRRLPLIIGGVLVMAVLGVFLVRGQGTEITQVLETVHQIDLQTQAAQREADVEELRAKKARLESEINGLETKLFRTDEAIRQLLSDPNVNPSEVQSASEGVIR